ncbi:hypothetical protein HYH02_011327 [Chlamydomonas schloesseri]|uniref:Anticodon-binding domain-containing protein n=1 Tax=Chlamydomonas schloesseri TaxID=2026947 RepID=A0A835W1G5_9CHLO|nr:hypothetical protein HYH02_011327 [Chlamydomonas schloesseri]|eukprot:KAG2437067.1 hypothetical protein HYH02_011327 [Chlamydomonas schloesseri]
MAADGESAKKGRKQDAGGNDSEKKRKRDAEPSGEQAAAVAAPADGGGAPADGVEGQRKKKNRHKRRKTEPENLDPAEAARRARQRELREVAMKMRQQGKAYVPPRKGSKPPRAEGGTAGGGGGGGGAGGGGRDKAGGGGGGGGGGAGGKDGDRKARHYLGDKTPGWRPFNAVEVIVLPIYWNNDKEEKAAVIAASERARDILASAGLAADMDGSNKYTPGQKMKYWETMGVRVRVELGPRDVANGNAVVALSTKKPGEVATKTIVNMRHKMLDAVREALGKVKSGAYDNEEEEEEAAAAEEQPEQEVEEDADEEQEEEEEEEAPAPKKGKKEGKKKSKKAASEEEEEAGEEQDEEEEGAKPGKGKGAVGVSADALEDDFGDLAVVIEPEEDKLVLSKKERLKKMDKVRKDQRKAERRAELGARGGGGGGGSEDGGEEQGGGGGWGAEEKGAGKKKAKKAKVVSF